MSAIDDLTAYIARVRALGASVPEIARAAVPGVEAALKAQIDAGTDPSGKPWQPTKEGKTPLRNAGAALTVSATGNVIAAVLTGVEVLHSLGRAKGGIVRQVLPAAGEVPASIGDAVIAAADRVFTAKMGE